jgi:hypothetical protein
MSPIGVEGGNDHPIPHNELLKLPKLPIGGASPQSLYDLVKQTIWRLTDEGAKFHGESSMDPYDEYDVAVLDQEYPSAFDAFTMPIVGMYNFFDKYIFREHMPDFDSLVDLYSFKCQRFKSGRSHKGEYTTVMEYPQGGSTQTGARVKICEIALFGPSRKEEEMEQAGYKIATKTTTALLQNMTAVFVKIYISPNGYYRRGSTILRIVKPAKN